MNFLKREWKNIALILFFVCIYSFIYRFDTVEPFIDFGREAYVPKAILDGAILYKDIFNIFGPFAYMFNALMYKFFGQSISTLYTLGCINIALLLIGMYALTRKYFDKLFSTIFILFILQGCCFLLGRILNFTLPYSYAMVYGLTAFIYSMIFCIKSKTSNNKLFMYLSFLFAGIAIANKYEYILYSIFLFIFFIKDFKKYKEWIISILILFFPIMFCFAILYHQGLTVSDFTKYLSALKIYSCSPALHKLYSGMFYFELKQVTKNLISMIIFTGVLSSIFILLKVIKKNISNYLLWFGAIGLSIVCAMFLYVKTCIFDLLVFMPIVLYILIFGKLKEIFKNKIDFFLLISLSLFSLKVLWGSNIYSYGQYFIFGIMLATFIVVQKYYIKTNFNKKLLRDSLLLYLVGLFCLFFILDCERVTYLNYKRIETPKGSFNVAIKFYYPMMMMYNFIQEETTPEDTVLILPESTLPNFLLNRKTDNFFNWIKPEIIETFGEKTIIEHYENQKPKYIIIQIREFAEEEFGKEYALEIMEWIKNNYELKNQRVVGTFDKRKDKKLVEIKIYKLKN